MGKDLATLTSRSLASPPTRFLSADEEKNYNRIVDEKYFSKNAREILKAPSNLFKVIELQNQGINVANLIDLGVIAEQNKDLISGFCIDAPIVVLRSIGDSHKSVDFLARDLAKQIGKNYLRNPIVVNNLKIKESAESAYGLKFKTTNKTEVYDAPELNFRNNEKTFSKTDERGIPIFDKNGSRTLYTGDGGFSRLYIKEKGDLDSNFLNLAFSTPNFRVVVLDKNTN